MDFPSALHKNGIGLVDTANLRVNIYFKIVKTQKYTIITTGDGTRVKPVVLEHPQINTHKPVA